MTEDMAGMIDRVCEKLADALGTNFAIVIFSIIAVAPLAVQVPRSILEWQQWLSQTCIQLVALAILQKGTRLEGKRAQALLQETHDTVMGEMQEIKEFHLEMIKQKENGGGPK